MNVDNVVEEIERLAVASGKLLLPNPYAPEENADPFIQKGFGVTVNSANGTEDFSFKQPFYTTDRSLGLVFTSKVIGNPQTDSVLKLAEKTIRNEAFDLFNQIYNNRTIMAFVTSLSFSSDELTFFGGEKGFENISFTLNVNFLIKEAI